MCSLICYNKIYSFHDRYSEYSLYWIIFNLKSKNKNQPLKALLTALLTYTTNSEMISIHHHDHPASVKEETWSENALKSPKYFFKHPQSFNNQVFPVSIKWYFPSSICSGQNHSHLPWFILLLSNTISNPSRNPIGYTFKRHPPSDQFSNPLVLPLNSKPSSSVFWIIVKSLQWSSSFGLFTRLVYFPHSISRDSVQIYVRSSHSTPQNFPMASHLAWTQSQNPYDGQQGPTEWIMPSPFSIPEPLSCCSPLSSAHFAGPPVDLSKQQQTERTCTFFFLFWPCQAACRGSPPGIEPCAPCRGSEES